MLEVPHINRRTLLGLAGISPLMILSSDKTWGAGVDSLGAMTTTPPFIAYSADSFFKSKVAGAPVDAARTAAFVKFMTTFADQKAFSAPTIKGLGTNKWGTAYAVGTAADPIWKLTGSVPSQVAWLKTVGFHAPAGFGKQLTGTSDSPFCVQDRATGCTVWASKTSAGSGNTITVAGSAGAYFHNTNGLDQRNPKSNGPRNFRSRGAIPDGMVIRRDLVDYGIANNTGLGHVLHMFMTETNAADGHCHPMVGHESQSGFGAEGERIFLKPSIDLTTRGLTPFGLVIARTLQTHGCYFGDNAGGESTLKAEQTSAAHNPWTGLVVSDKVLLNKITWADFQVATRGWQ